MGTNRTSATARMPRFLMRCVTRDSLGSCEPARGIAVERRPIA
jgi:hypothetical protein